MPRKLTLGYQILGNYSILEIRGSMPIIRDTKKLYLSVYRSFSELYPNCKYCLFSRFVDEDQEWPSNIKYLHELIDSNPVDIKMNIGYNDNSETTYVEKKYILNMIGKAGGKWIDRVFNIGGTNLQNIIYGVEEKDIEWHKNVSSKNKKFYEAYFSEKESENITKINKNGEFLCWTSDNYFYLLCESTNVFNSILRTINAYAMDEDLSIEIIKI